MVFLGRRREFIALIGGAAAAWPRATRAQQPAMPVIGLLSGRHLDNREFGAIRQGLSETGYNEGRNVAIEYRSADGQYDRLPELAIDLVRRRVAVIIAVGSTASAPAAKTATATIPIVFTMGDDPVKYGLVASLNRPEGNLTGVSFLTNVLGAKRLELLRELVRAASAVGFLVNPTNPSSDSETGDLQRAAGVLGLQIEVQKASSEGDLDSAFANFTRRQVDALVVAGDGFFLGQRDQLVALAARHALPTMYVLREFAAAGGMMSYGTSITHAYRLAGVYAGKILAGAKPGDLPVQQSTKFELVINLKTTKALGLDVPDRLLALADEVIE